MVETIISYGEPMADHEVKKHLAKEQEAKQPEFVSVIKQDGKVIQAFDADDNFYF